MASGNCDIQYSMDSPSRVALSVYDLMGREVRRLVDGSEPAGQHRVVWNCTDTNGLPVAAGEYFIRLDTPAVRDAQKVIITR
jgi:flagellar hook assembly protein FlgD